MKTLVIILGALLASTSWARLSDGKVTFAIKNGKIQGSVEKGFHFNKDAPASFSMRGSNLAPVIKSEKELAFVLPAKENENFDLNFYICDDQKTVCEEHQMTYALSSGKLKSAGEAPSQKTPPKSASPSQITGKIENNAHGFIVNNLEAAKKLALKTKKNLLVDYGAPWCPACVRLETEVFGTKEFKSATQDLILVALNADMTANKTFGQAFNIKAIPTVLFLNSEGQELYRIVDFVLAKEYAARILTAKKNFSSNNTDLEKAANNGDQKALHFLAEKAYDSYDMETATKWYSKLDNKPPRFAFAEMNMWAAKVEADKKFENEYLAILKKWSASAPLSYVAITASTDWAAYLGDEKKELPSDLKTTLKTQAEFLKKLTESKAAVLKWATIENAELVSPLERADMLAKWMNCLKPLELKEELVVAQKELQKELSSLKYSEKRPGEILMTLQYFRKAEMTSEEEAWLQKLASAEPKNYVFHMKLANFYKRNKSFQKALPEAKLAVELGEDLRLYNLQTLAEIQKELKQKDEAKKTIELALAHPEVKTERYKKLLEDLEEIKKSL